MLIPVHLAGCHWGLIAIDMLFKVLYFDDGMKYNPPSVDLPNAIIADEHLRALSWLQLHKFHRFDMPCQPTDGSHQGSGSCGVGGYLGSKRSYQLCKRAFYGVDGLAVNLHEALGDKNFALKSRATWFDILCQMMKAVSYLHTI